MTAKQYLLQVERLDNEIVQLKERLEEIRTPLLSITVDPSKEAVDGSSKGGNMADSLLDEIEKVSQMLSRRRMEAVVLKAKISLQIQELKDPRFVRLLYRHYIDHITLDSLAVEMGYEYYYFARLHGYALKAFAEQWPELLQEDNKSQIEV